MGFWKSRAKVQVDASLSLSLSGPQFLILRATNVGQKEVTIEGLAMLRGSQPDFRPRSTGELATLAPIEQLEHRWISTINPGPSPAAPRFQLVP